MNDNEFKKLLEDLGELAKKASKFVMIDFLEQEYHLMEIDGYKVDMKQKFRLN